MYDESVYELARQFVADDGRSERHSKSWIDGCSESLATEIQEVIERYLAALKDDGT